MTDFRARLGYARLVWDECRFESKMDGGMTYSAHCVYENYLERERQGKWDIRPTKLGAWLLVIANELNLVGVLIRHVVTGYRPDYWANDPYEYQNLDTSWLDEAGTPWPDSDRIPALELTWLGKEEGRSIQTFVSDSRWEIPAVSDLANEYEVHMDGRRSKEDR